ncbi:tRNA lysidine(34) synthetase TilS [Spiroplasma endosymbiont of Agriotes lineatus]|uniref:tRNA lysidine(34) synthetase TilS n=1 Tax=Spiroplasma endosymbiont of Agriotes lineatus TaxID=3077930 RepID=UPI0030D3EB6F
MKKFYESLDIQEKYLLGISGGTDSMFLLDNLYQAGFKIFVVHINYQKRTNSWQDESIVVNYCLKNNIEYAVLRVKPEQYGKENFQNQARKIRYDFFMKIAKKQKIFNLVIAHQFNDLLETYLLQKQRKSLVSYYGLLFKRKIKNLTVFRPMLKVKKQMILNYLEKKQLDFQVDDSNGLDIYARNVIRKKIAYFSNLEINNLLQEINEKNILLKEEQQKIIKLLVLMIIDDKINYKLFLLLEEKWQQKLIYQYLLIIDDELVTKNYLKRILNGVLKSNKPNIHIKLNDQWIFIKEYKFIYLSKPIIKDNYCYTITNLKNFKSRYLILKLKNNGNIKGMGFFVANDEFPIYIKCNEFNEKIKTKNGTKKINRLFINNKISFQQRINWPVIYNCHQQLIVIPMLAVDANHLKNKSNWFMLK